MSFVEGVDSVCGSVVRPFSLPPLVFAFCYHHKGLPHTPSAASQRQRVQMVQLFRVRLGPQMINTLYLNILRISLRTSMRCEMEEPATLQSDYGYIVNRPRVEEDTRWKRK